ncbi:hypothetical protein [Nannocystis bainbridge]|uniref:Outer membrane protein beta-barrel domain-containing protein n=1 Tax=Nannocystis bainbridge TaxID=2995303 RepID=A0ABT5E8V9_9BACT|nr:hypothetical protein [Nannocystis bainbridge]MDC0722070.1 hypothetical protein [Nannocystis bainbridge]
MGVRAVCVLAATLAFARVAHAGPPWGTDDGSFQATYLQAGDLASPSDMTGDWAKAGCEPGAAQFGCTHWGKKLWTAKDASTAMWQVHDLRWVFPSADAAARFMPSAMDELAEGLPPVNTPPAVGADTRMFTAQGDTYGIGIEVIMYNLVFRVDNVVVKLFVAQGPEAKQRKILTPLMVAALGQKAVERIRAAEPRGVAAAPVPVQPQPQPVEPVPAPSAPVESVPVAPTPEPAPEPAPERSKGRLAREIKDYWRGGSHKSYVFVGGNYSKAFGDYTLSGLKLTEKNGFDISIGALLHPRAYVQFTFHRDVWQVPKVEELLVRRVEIIYGFDLLALPPDWRVRPALMALLGFGLGFGRTDSLVGEADPNLPAPLPMVKEGRAIGIGGIFGGDFALHIRVTRGFELAPYAGITLPAYRYSNDFPAAERHIDGERGFGRAWRWHVGLKIGFQGSR